MKTRLSIFATLMVLVMAAFAAPADAKGPLHGEMDLQFNLAWPGPQTEIPDWVGTITIDDDVYGMAFFNTGSGKPFEDNPSDVVFFEETWVIYDELAFTFDGFVLTEFDPGEVVLSGYDRGIVTIPNSSYHMNGDVRVAEGELAGWLGRNVHMSGEIVWGDGTVYPLGAPQYAPGAFRIN
jgi:hypothetical protein